MSNRPPNLRDLFRRLVLATAGLAVALPVLAPKRCLFAADASARLPAERTSADAVPNWIAVLRQRGQARIEHAYDLASRGAVYSGQQELFGVLAMVAQTIDTQHRTNQHSAALSAAILALNEADDFCASQAPGASEPDLTTILASHQSTVVAPDEAGKITPLTALQRYYTFAQSKFVEAAHGEPLAGEALYGLGRLQTLLNGNTPRTGLSEQKTLVFYMAAVSIDPQHYVAANELGVLLSRLGQFAYAQKALEQSVGVSAQIENCNNLLAVYERNGETKRAADLRRHCQSNLAGQFAKPQAGRPVPEVKWVTAEVFASSGPASELDVPARNQPLPGGDLRASTEQHPNPTAQNPRSESAPPLRRWLNRVKETVSRP